MGREAIELDGLNAAEAVWKHVCAHWLGGFVRWRATDDD